MKNRSMGIFFAALFALTSCFVSGCGTKSGETSKKAEVTAKAGAAPMKAGVKKIFRDKTRRCKWFR
jgi:hypothetical protein